MWNCVRRVGRRTTVGGIPCIPAILLHHHRNHQDALKFIHKTLISAFTFRYAFYLSPILPKKVKIKYFFPSPTYVHLHLLTKNVTFAANVIHTSTSFNAIVSPPLSPVLSLTFLHTQRVRQCFFFHGGRRFFVNILDKIVDFQKYFLRNRCRLQIVGTKSISRAGLADLHVKVLPRIAEAQWSMPPLC